MKKITVYLLIAILASCTIRYKTKSEYKTEQELVNFYKNQGIDKFWVPKDRKSLEELYKADRLTMPQNIVFNADGYEILLFNDKLCSGHTLEFLKNFHEGMELKLSKYHISDYVKYLKSIPDNMKGEEAFKSGEITVFVNSATFGQKLHGNEEAFEIYKLYKEKFNIQVVSIDFRVGEEEQSN